MSDALITPAQLAEMFDLTEAKVMELRRKHDWPHVRLGRRFRFTPEQVARIIADHTATSDGAQPAADPFGLTDRGRQRARAG